MRILILGGNGMIGHHLVQSLSQRHHVKATFRQFSAFYGTQNVLGDEDIISQIDVRVTHRLNTILENFSPDVVINSTGVTKQLVDKIGITSTIHVNSLFPHHLARMCEQHRCRLVQFSTDCIFSGAKGSYNESDNADATDIYGRSKILGEVDADHVVTLRKSTVGLETGYKHGLVEWFLSQRGEVKGFTNAFFTGVITAELVQVIEKILIEFPLLSGVWNVAGPRISKFDLLTKLQREIKKDDITIVSDDTFMCDRSLDGSRFESETGYRPPTWDQMLKTLGNQIKSRNNNFYFKGVI